MKFFEDLPLGQEIALGHHHFSAEEIKRFAVRYDPQPFHLDEARAAESHFGRLCASGWHTAAVSMRLMARHGERVAREAAQAGLPVPRLEPAIGFDNLRWLKPVYADDVIDYVMTFVGKLESRSRPDWGIASAGCAARNGETLVLTVTAHLLVKRRDPTGAASPQRSRL
jgi:acyl dehydratase